jgi:hypothetical protein
MNKLFVIFVLFAFFAAAFSRIALQPYDYQEQQGEKLLIPVLQSKNIRRAIYQAVRAEPTCRGLSYAEIDEIIESTPEIAELLNSDEMLSLYEEIAEVDGELEPQIWVWVIQAGMFCFLNC